MNSISGIARWRVLTEEMCRLADSILISSLKPETVKALKQTEVPEDFMNRLGLEHLVPNYLDVLSRRNWAGDYSSKTRVRS
jgi:hypothetical protein